MKQFSSAAFPILMTGLLAGLSFGLQQYVQAPEEPSHGPIKHEPDAIVTQLDIHQMDSTGQLKYRLRSPRMLHYADDETSYLESPLLIAHRKDGPPTTLTAKQANINSDSSEVLLEGNVNISRPAYSQHPPLLAKMSKLTIYPDEAKAYTNTPVDIRRGESWLTGIGLSIEHDYQKYVVHQAARAMYVKTP